MPRDEVHNLPEFVVGTRKPLESVICAEMVVYSSEGGICSGEFRIDNPKVGGSILPPATKIPNYNLDQKRKIELKGVVVKLL